MNRRVLVIDDESSIRLLLKINLEARGFEVHEAATAEAGIERAQSSHPHLILLDLGLPDMNGLTVLRQLRQWTQVPIVILTVDDSELSKVELLEAGADDYITKPFGVSELAARIKVALRHHEQIEGANSIFTSADLRVDLAKRSVERSGQTIKLTSTEFEVLRRLVLNAGRVVSQEFLLKDIWGKHALDNGHYLRIYIAHLRKKIETDPSNPKHIITEPGVGYRLL